MSLIVVEGHTIETKEIWEIKGIYKSRECGVKIKLIDKPTIYIGRSIPYETYPSEFRGYYAPYEKLEKSLIEQWEADKTELKVFKL